MKLKYDSDRRRLLLWPETQEDVALVLRLPSRRWLKTARMFIVPLHRLNAVEVAGHLERWGAHADVVAAVMAAAYPEKPDRKFPDWFVFKTTPRSHQRTAIRKMYANDVGAIFMDMGCGKSKTAIDLVTSGFYEQRIDLVVIVCPLSVKSQWWNKGEDGVERGQIATHCPSPFVVTDFGKTREAPRVDGVRLPFTLVGIESLSAGHSAAELLMAVRGRKFAMICDESSRIKNISAIRTKAMIEIGRTAAMKYIMTGTPIVKNLIDLYAQFEFLDPNIIGVGDYYAFRNRYAVMGGYKNKEIVGYDNVDELMRFIEPYTYECKKNEVLDLPPKIKPPPRYVTLSKPHMDFYKRARQQKIESLSTKNVLEKILRLRQIVGGWVPDETGKLIEVVPPAANAKLQELLGVIDETSGQVVVWAAFIPEVAAIAEKLRAIGGGVSIIVGAESGVEGAKGAVRADEIHKFQSGQNRFLVGTQQSGGIGIELTAASTVVYYSNTRSLEDRLQSEDRAHRDGLTHSVTYVDIVAERTTDVLLLQSIMDKKDLADYVSEKLREASLDALLDLARVREV